MFGSNKASTFKCSVMDRTPQMTSTPASTPASAHVSTVNFALEYERACRQVEAEEQQMSGPPPRRPQRDVPQPPGYQQSREYQRARDDFLADFETIAFEITGMGHRLRVPTGTRTQNGPR